MDSRRLESEKSDASQGAGVAGSFGFVFDKASP